jgi:hypothetical protein
MKAAVTPTWTVPNGGAVAECGHTWELGPHGLGDAALHYAALGYAVVPLVRGGKRPHKMLPAEGGVHWASTDPQTVVAWWLDDPAANIGIATGSRSQLAVVDLDVKAGADGPGNFYRLLSDGGGRGIRGQEVRSLEWPDPPYVTTPSGGVHLWLRAPAGYVVPERPGILRGVDVKGDGGLVVAPPSAGLRVPAPHPGDQTSGEPVPIPYAWASGCPCTAPAAPSWLHQWLITAPPAAGGSVGVGDGDTPDVEEAKRAGFREGSRNVNFYRLACSLYRRYGTGPDGAAAVWHVIGEVWDASDQAGMNRGELARICASARSFIEKAEQADWRAYESWRAAHGG